MAGRPTVMTVETLALLKEAFQWGCTDVEACLHAEISEDALYDYQRVHPEYTKQKAAWKQRPILIARKKVVETMENDAELSMKYLERKKKDEFSPRSELDANVTVNPIKSLLNTLDGQTGTIPTGETFESPLETE